MGRGTAFSSNEPNLIETYRGHDITTRLANREGVRIYRPHRDGILDFANTVTEAKELIDKEMDGGW